MPEENKINNETGEKRPQRPRPLRKKKKRDIINNSGQGDVPSVKVVTDKFNWGAFILTWIWGIHYKKWVTLLIFPAILIPPIALVLQIWFGIVGNKWAWQSKRYKSIQEFHDIQKKWATVGVWIIIINIIVTLATLIIAFQQGISQNMMMNTPTQGFSIDNNSLNGNFNNKEVIVTLDGKTKYSSTYNKKNKTKQQTRKTYTPNQTYSVDLTKPYTGN